MLKSFKKTYLIIFIPYLALGIYLFYRGLIVPSNGFMSYDYFLKNSFYFEGLSCIIVPIIIIAGISLYNKRSYNKEIDPAQNSIKGEAEILDIEQTGMYINELPQVKFILQINIPNKPPYQMEHEKIMNSLILNSLHIGAKIPVFVDPTNSERILLGYYLYFQ